MRDEPSKDNPEITIIGDGDVVAAVVAGVHGDEPCGVRAIEGIVEDEAAGRLAVTGAVALVTANPPAVAANRRYLEVDMNRSFPGKSGGRLEERLASIVCETVADVPTLALHATRSLGTPFAFASRHDPLALELACGLSVPNLVLAEGADIGSLSACGTVVTVEAGLQGTDEAATQARALTEEFLVATGAMAGPPVEGDPVVFDIGEEIVRPAGTDFEVLVTNFERVDAGDAYARVDGRELVAEEAFYPVLLSADGYEDILGFRGTKVADSVAEIA